MFFIASRTSSYVKLCAVKAFETSGFESDVVLSVVSELYKPQPVHLYWATGLLELVDQVHLPAIGQRTASLNLAL